MGIVMANKDKKAVQAMEGYGLTLQGCVLTYIVISHHYYIPVVMSVIYFKFQQEKNGLLQNGENMNNC